MQNKFRFLFAFLTFIFILTAFSLSGQAVFENPETTVFIRKEFNAGIGFYLSPEREQLFTDESFFMAEQDIGAAVIGIEGNHLYYLPSRQELWSYRLEAGPFLGKGNLADSSATEYIDAEMSPAGIRGKLQAAYSSRFYWDSKNYTIVGVNAWGLYDVYRRKAEGTVIDSLDVSMEFEDNESLRKFRYGFQAKAGWGIGRISPVNHYSAARYLMEKYYPGRNFSEEELNAVAREIGRIKHQRNLRTGHSPENEEKQLAQFLNTRLFLEAPVGMENDWKLTEFRPRLHGSRLEFGPFFNYFNREPDFVYGGYIRYENQKYCNQKLNRKLNAGANYNGYKKDDWITFEATAGWNWFPSLKHEFSFGISYLPGMRVKSIDDLQPVHHAVVPYLEYFTQMNPRYRMEMAFAYRIANKDEFILPGPELSVSLYRSSY